MTCCAKVNTSPPFMGATPNRAFFPCRFSDTRFKVESENVTGSPLKPRASTKHSSHKVVAEPWSRKAFVFTSSPFATMRTGTTWRLVVTFSPRTLHTLDYSSCDIVCTAQLLVTRLRRSSWANRSCNVVWWLEPQPGTLQTTFVKQRLEMRPAWRQPKLNVLVRRWFRYMFRSWRVPMCFMFGRKTHYFSKTGLWPKYRLFWWFWWTFVFQSISCTSTCWWWGVKMSPRQYALP